MNRFVLNYSVRTHQGCVRSNNEDNYYVNGIYKKDTNINQQQLNGSADAKCFLASVCDGMGGEEKGELASLEAVKALKPSAWNDITAVSSASIKVANDAVCNIIRENDGKRSGSTLAALYVDDNKAISCNLGDSPIYLFRNGTLTKLSTDHNMASRMIASGLMTEEEARTWKGRHQITQYIGIFEEEMILAPSYSQPIELQDNDIFLICSDGLTDMQTDEQIQQALANSTDDVQKTVDGLIDAALAAGGKDNVTIVLIKVKQSAVPVATSAPEDKSINKALVIVAIITLLIIAFFAGFLASNLAGKKDKSSSRSKDRYSRDKDDDEDEDEDDEDESRDTQDLPTDESGDVTDVIPSSSDEDPEETTDETSVEDEVNPESTVIDETTDETTGNSHQSGNQTDGTEPDDSQPTIPNVPGIPGRSDDVTEEDYIEEAADWLEEMWLELLPFDVDIDCWGDYVVFEVVIEL